MTWWITTALSNATTVAVLALPVYSVCRYRRRPALTHALWVLLLLKLVTPPLVTVPLPWELHVSSPEVAAWLAADHAAKNDRTGAGSQVADASASAAASTGMPSIAGDEFISASFIVNSPLSVRMVSWLHSLTAIDYLHGLLCLWGCGSVLLAIGVSRKAWAFRRRLRGGRVDSGVLQASVNNLSRELRLGTGPQAVFTDRAVSPMLWGVGPCVWLVFPRALWERIGDDERRTLLMHELGHYARRDPWVRLLELVVSVLFWWHPVVWWGLRTIEQAGEECCDALVLDWEDAPRTYAEAIVSTLDFLSERPIVLPPMASGVSDVPALKLRLTQIMQRTVAPRLSTTGRRAMIAWCLVTMLVHPFFPLAPLPSVEAALSVDRELRSVAVTGESTPVVNVETPVAPRRSQSAAERAMQLLPLPEVPAGWWTRPAENRWATSESPTGNWRLVADTGRKVRLLETDGDTVYDLRDAAIAAVAWLPSGDRFVTGSATGKVQLWDAARGEAISTLGAPGIEILSIAVDSTGRWAATGSVDGAVLIWDLGSGAIVGAWRAPAESPVNSVRFSPDGRELAAAVGEWRRPDATRVLRIDPATVELTGIIDVPGTVAALHYDQFNHLRIARWTGHIDLWDLEFQTLVPIGTATKLQLASAAFSPQGEF